jgi:homocitrate synthase NifV
MQVSRRTDTTDYDFFHPFVRLSPFGVKNTGGKDSFLLAKCLSLQSKAGGARKTVAGMGREVDLWVIDTTLRDGEQAPGVSFTAAEKMRLAQLLDEVGVDEIEAGTPAMGQGERETIGRIVGAGLRARISVWCRALREDIEGAYQTGARAVHIAFPVSDRQLHAMGKDRGWVERALPEMTSMAQGLFDHVSVGAQDAGRCDRARLLTFARRLRSLGVERMRLADTVGTLTPTETQKLIASVRRCCPDLPIDFHAHNDLGLATANAVTAWQSGAVAVSVTVNGLGERAGNAALEEFLMAVRPRIASPTRYRTERLAEVCAYAARISGRPIPVGKPVCGRYAYSHESGIHAQGTLSGATVFQAFDGRQAGRESSRNLFGKHSGRTALAALLENRGLSFDPESLDALLSRIKQTATAEKRALSEEEVLAILDAGQ